MPRKPPAEPIDHHYNIPKLNRAFFATAAVLALVFVVMVIEDYSRGWKAIQRAFLRLDARKTREAALEARTKAFGDERARLLAELRSARSEVRRQRATLQKLNARLEDLDPKVYLADQEYRFTKASFDAALYKYEDALATRPRAAPSARKDLDRLRSELERATVRLADLKRRQDQTRSQVKGLTARREQAELAIENLSSDFRLARHKYAGLKQDTLFKLRNSPIFDMINPSLRVQQVQLPEHFNDVNFMKIPRVDRCATCHIASERKGFEEASIRQIFRTHPRLNLMVGSESPHPYNAVGCTPCHGGRDRASSFWSAGHSPETEREVHRWERAFDWKFDRFNDTPILPMKYTDAGCYRCHSDEAGFPEAPKLDAGLKLVEGLGCWGCHRIQGLEKQGLRRVGPSLEKIASKLDRKWTTRWVMDPAAFRPNTKMPSFFYLENFVDVSGPRKPSPAQERMNAEGRVENDTMVNSIVAYLYDRSPSAPVPPVEGRGDAAAGQRLVSDRGCLGCHIVDPGAGRDLTGTWRQFGPNLAGVGGKASRDWIYHWVLDPKAWSPETRMPNLRLTPAEALDIAEYLSTLPAPPAFASRPLPRTDPAVLDRIALYFEMSTKTLFDAKAALAKMDLRAREVYVGERLIAHYGCYACHAIPGFENAKPIGTELTEEGSKAVHRLDFGFVHVPHTRFDWFEAKLHNPRLFDRDRARGWEEKLRMPNFRLSQREQEQVVTAVLGFQKLNAAPTARHELDPQETAIERGRRIVRNSNCQGCHVLEGFGGSIRSLVSDLSLAPPIIQGQGAKVQSDWLFRFLKAPRTGEIRPWLEVHMPTFGFSEEELNDLTQYFAFLDRARYPFLVPDDRTDPNRWAAGRKVFELLRCRQCHPRSEEEMNAPGVDRASLAPNLQMSSTRLRHDWINDWIRRPDEWMPGTRMPTNFPKGEDGHRTSPLAGMLDTPGFAKDREEFARMLGSEANAREFLSDPDAVTKALRDYVWSIGINGGSAPAGPPPAPSPATGGTLRAEGRPPAPRAGAPADHSR